MSAGDEPDLAPSQDPKPVEPPLVDMHTERAIRQISRRQQQEEDRSILRLAQYFYPY